MHKVVRAYRQVMDASDGAVAQGGAGALGPLEQIADLTCQIRAGQGPGVRGTQLGFEFGDQLVGAVEVDTGGLNAAGQKAFREGLQLATDLEPEIGDSLHGLQQLRRHFTAEELLQLVADQVAELACGDLVTVGERVPNRLRQGIGGLEAQPAEDEVVGHHAAQKTASSAVGRDDEKGLAFALAARSAGAMGVVGHGRCCRSPVFPGGLDA